MDLLHAQLIINGELDCSLCDQFVSSLYLIQVRTTRCTDALPGSTLSEAFRYDCSRADAKGFVTPWGWCQCCGMAFKIFLASQNGGVRGRATPVTV